MHDNQTETTADNSSGSSALLCDFIAHDWCGWNEQQGRFTAMPNGETLVCQPWMGQNDWDKAQLEWFKRFSGSVVVHRCGDGPYRETGNIMGTVAGIAARLRARSA
jgi:hypothetical protein